MKFTLNHLSPIATSRITDEVPELRGPIVEACFKVGEIVWFDVPIEALTDSCLDVIIDTMGENLEQAMEFCSGQEGREWEAELSEMRQQVMAVRQELTY